ncbi:permease [Candidatus Bipolaricaulota bacterium]|nr:permease [Candidatus Bipolaricaulota bacterium]
MSSADDALEETQGKDKTEGKKEMIRDWLILLALAIGGAVLLSFFPTKIEPSLSVGKNYLVEMAWILPAVMVLMGLFKVWISKELVVKYLGKASGLKGIFIAALLGSTPTGPLYVAFPLAAAMFGKGARVLNVVVFLSAWACMKIPQEMIEIQFLGLGFMATRLVLTLVSVSIMGLFMEKIIERTGSLKVQSNV